MSLFDFFFPEEAQASHLRRLADSHSVKNTQARLARSRVDRSISSADKRIKQLEDELGQMTILVESLLECIEAQGLVSRDQIAQKIGEIDMRDGVIDGRMTKNEPTEVKPSKPKLQFPDPY